MKFMTESAKNRLAALLFILLAFSTCGLVANHQITKIGQRIRMQIEAKAVTMETQRGGER